jgi:hypothetical protein
MVESVSPLAAEFPAWFGRPSTTFPKSAFQGLAVPVLVVIIVDQVGERLQILQ